MDQNSAPDGGTSTREAIIEAAGRLFYRFGFQAVGVDRIAQESDVAKMTLYRYFPSKDDLIVAYLSRASDQFWDWLDGAAATADAPIDKVLAIFDRLEDRCRSAKFVGCTFQSAAAEFPDRGDPINQVAREHKEKLRERMQALLDGGGIANARAASNQLVLVMEGALASARLLALPVPAREAGGAARAILQAHSSPPTDAM